MTWDAKAYDRWKTSLPEYQEESTERCLACGEITSEHDRVYRDGEIFCSYICYFNYLVDIEEVEYIELGKCKKIVCASCGQKAGEYCFRYNGKDYCSDECVVDVL